MANRFMDCRPGTLYITKEDGSKVELGMFKEARLYTNEQNPEHSPITKLGEGEIELEATMDLSGWQNVIFKYMWCNNYRKMLGVPMKRRKSMMKARKRRYNSIMRRCYGSVKIGNYIWRKLENGK